MGSFFQILNLFSNYRQKKKKLNESEGAYASEYINQFWNKPVYYVEPSVTPYRQTFQNDNQTTRMNYA